MMLTAHPAPVNRCERGSVPIYWHGRCSGVNQLICPPGKEIVMRTLMVLMTVAMLGTALVGCRASGELGDTQTTVAPAR